MAKNNLIELHCFGREIGKIGFDETRNASFFQYNQDFLNEGLFKRMFPFVIKRISQTQVFDKYNNESFRCLPPMFADSLPDTFGNQVFRAWLENNEGGRKISIPEQLAYVGKRGMGALEYWPAKDLAGSNTIDLEKITVVVSEVLAQKSNLRGEHMTHEALLNIFKIGTSAGGLRPKILVSEHKETGEVVAGDLVFSDEYRHYIIKLGIGNEDGYSREKAEYAYYKMAMECGIIMKHSWLIDGKHFATERFDRQNGVKKHVLTATGLTGWDFMSSKESSYENLFKLGLNLKVTPADLEQLFKRMVFNIKFANHDDHLKNHSFIYNEAEDSWALSPAYDLTFSLNPLINYTKTSRALSVNDRRQGIQLKDVKEIANAFTIKNASSIIQDVDDMKYKWDEIAEESGVPEFISKKMKDQFATLSK